MSDTAFEGVVRELREEFRAVRQELAELSAQVGKLEPRRTLWQRVING